MDLTSFFTRVCWVWCSLDFLWIQVHVKNKQKTLDRTPGGALCSYPGLVWLVPTCSLGLVRLGQNQDRDEQQQNGASGHHLSHFLEKRKQKKKRWNKEKRNRFREKCVGQVHFKVKPSFSLEMSATKQTTNNSALHLRLQKTDPEPERGRS